MLHCDAAACNKDVILSILLEYVALMRPDPRRCLEIASGTGQHVVHFAANLPGIEFLPSECDPLCLASIQAHVDASPSLINVRAPLRIDVMTPLESWGLPAPPPCIEICININMVHISPWSCTLALFEKTAACLVSGGILLIYGPFAVDGVISPQTNVRFDAYLRGQDPAWGYRDVRDLESLATIHGLRLEEMRAVPSNNLVLVWRKS
ncbi:Aste57867_18966 [Aphanomyces stellatus]|uniref:Aste57867_18966 protein n=1 Tax=Aphanomyces stellatus TaxID=120398 RepID=A0A485LC27_9STRA|nr:hypothetical protein As57867_018902 [Aphanomyces stellatus]VFT95695.1 Aste57867_18966 [Aphanomyces stellatus]